MSTSRRRSALGIALGLAAGLAFGVGGPIIKPLFAEGWSPGAAVLGRLAVGALLLTLPALATVRFDLRPLLRSWRIVLAYSLLAVVTVQLAFYAAMERIPVGIALLIEYLAPIALLALAWARSRRMPHRLVLLGAGLSVAGLLLVIGPTGDAALDPIGVVLAVIAMIGVAFYYAVGDRTTDVPPITLAWAGFVVATIALALAGTVGVLPLGFAFGEVTFLGAQAPWWMPLLTVGAVSTAFAYVAGFTAIRMLGARVASFLGLSEVVFAGVVGWIVLGEAIAPLGLVGAALILGGIVLVRLEPGAVDSQPIPEPMPPTAPIEIVPRPGGAEGTDAVAPAPLG